MLNKILDLFVLAGLVALMAVAIPAFAQDTSSTPGASAETTGVAAPSTTGKKDLRNTVNAESIACVKAAVATRETALSGAYSKFSADMSAAYATRATTLAGAYSNGTAKEVQKGVKVAWEGFKKSSRAAGSAWKKAKNEAWAAFKKSAKGCKAPSGVPDSGNSGSEPSGN